SIISNLAESYRRIRNTARFLLANLNGFVPERDLIPHSELSEVDQYVLLRLASIIDDAKASFDAYEFHLPMFKIHQFCDNELSAFYIDISKEKLYADREDSHPRRCARSVMWEVLSSLTSMIAPVLCFTAEEIWQEMRGMDPSLPESVHLSEWPDVSREGMDAGVTPRWDRVMEARGAVTRALETARSQGIIGHALDASVWAVFGSDYADIDYVTESEWETITIVSGFKKSASPLEADVTYEDALTGITVGVGRSRDAKCPRCWKHRPEVGEKEVCDRCADALEHMRG
ncbi:MAG: class I tRNA ligase family protein, partial [Synergistaceae bacterium]|nr:class I tRNA ligase family protein [Synergistaceae bacterium]